MFWRFWACFPAVAVLVLSTGFASAQPKTAPPGHNTSNAGQPIGEQVLKKMGGGRPAVIALVNGRGPFHLIIDTASSHTVFGSPLIDTLGLKPTDKAPTAIATVGGMQSSRTYLVDTITTAGVTAEGFEVLALNSLMLGGADGILGADFLSNVTVELDWPQSRFRLYALGVVPNVSGFLKAVAKPDKRNLLIIPARCESLRCQAIVDTGALISLGNPQLGEGLPKFGEPQIAIDYLEVNGLSKMGITAYSKDVRRLRFGDFDFRRKDVAIANVPVFWRLEEPTTPTLFVGLDVFGYRHMILDYKTRTVYQKP